MTLVIAIGSRVGSAVRGSLGIFNACERLRARRSPGNVLTSKKAMTANTIMTWTIMRPFRMYLRHGILRMVRLRDFQTGLSVRLLDLSRTKKNAAASSEAARTIH